MLPEWFGPLVARAREVDGQPPFSDQSLVEARSGERELLSVGEVAAALVTATEAELVVDPDARGHGTGTALVERVIAHGPLRQAQGPLLVWAHGDHPAARALAARFGFEPVRRLLQLRLSGLSSARGTSPRIETSLSTSEISIRPQAAYSIHSFRPGYDDAAWLALNARAFAFHLEQGSVDQHDLDELMSEDWFDAENFLVLRDGETMIGYCWLKVDPSTGSGTEIGELYVVGVDPDRQGQGLGRLLVEAGLARLAALDIRSAALYVEADNTPALRLYESFGFSEYAVDIQYRLDRDTLR